MKSNALFPVVFAMTFLASALSPKLTNLFFPKSGTERYCNERFEFCVEYPNSIFTETLYSDNGDGVILTTEKDQLQMTISGMYNPEDRSTEEVMDEIVSDLDHKLLETKATDDDFIVRYVDEEDMAHYLKAVRLRDRYVYVDVVADKSRKLKMKLVTENLRIFDNPAISTSGIGAP